MAVSASLTHDTITIGEPTSGSEAATRGFVAVNNGSADESDVSSRLSSPHETVQRVGDVSSRPPSSGLYPLPQSHDENHHKRKRSGSDEGAKYDQQRQYSYTPPKRPEAQHMANRALRVLGNTDQNGSSYHVNGTGAESNGHSWPSPPGRSGHPPMHANGSSGPTSDAQLAEALQRETSAQEDQSRDWDTDAQANGDADHEHFASDPQSGANMSGTKRKRNFSNRTKTGCLTCRRRKKKCDEGHPICLNCKKGGFTCGGYSVTRGLWPAKPTPVKPPVRLQSKVDGGGDVSESSTYQPDRSAETSPNSARPSAQFDGGQRRSIPSIEHDHQRPQHYPPGPAYNETRTRAPYPVPPPPQPQQWPPQQSQSPYTSEHLPPLSDLGRPDTNSNPPSRDMSRPSTQLSPHSQAPPHPLPSSQAPPPPPPPPPSHQAPPPNRPSPNTHQPPGPPPSAYAAHAHPHQAPGPAPPHYGYGPPPPPPDTRHQYHPPPPEHHTPSHMRMSSASYESHKSTARTFNKEDVERSKMLRHTAYNHFDPTLEDDRRRCQQALKRFNQAAELGSGVSVEEQRNILLKVFDPSKDTTHRFLAAPMEKGTLSHGVRIEYPFKCTYGYNVKIMDSVYIGSGCKFDDAGRVDIGARTWIGPGVTIVTTGVSEEMIDRKGSGGSWKASPVTIASEVVIGEGAKICPGVVIGKGATVEPFALVKENLGEYERQCADQGPRRR